MTASNVQPLPTPHMNREEDYSKVCVRDLALDMLIGVYDFEKQKKQPVIINVDLWVTPPITTPSGIHDVVSYEDIVTQVTEIASSGHIDLVEQFAEQIAEICLAYPQSLKVLVKIEKTQIMPQTASVGVEILRTQQ